jgi:hypothetical protein
MPGLVPLFSLVALVPPVSLVSLVSPRFTNDEI